MRQAPSMTGLRVLEAVVRTGSLSAAARELCVTPAAVSHRLRDIEAHCGTALVRRNGGRFEPTGLGQSVLDALGDAFLRIRAADAILSKDPVQVLRIASSYSFAVLWLAPRLLRFQQQRPEVKLYLDPSHTPLTQPEADIVILHAAESPPGPGWSRLFSDRCVAVARAGHPVFATLGAGPAEVLLGRLVHISHQKGPAWGEFSWHNWARALLLTGPIPVQGPTVSAEHLAVDLVLAEDAFALIGRVNAAHLISEGRLIAMPGSEVETGFSYWVRSANPEGGIGPHADAFLAWIKEELDC